MVPEEFFLSKMANADAKSQLLCLTNNCFSIQNKMKKRRKTKIRISVLNYTLDILEQNYELKQRPNSKIQR